MNISRIYIPADVPPEMHATFTENMQALTQDTDNFFIFSCDQKIEHLNDDFFGETISSDALYPEHLFNIAAQAPIGAMAVPLGLLTRYGTLYSHVNYIAKLNGMTNAIPVGAKDPLSAPLWSVENAIHCKEFSNINIRGVGFTVYVGSEYESSMLSAASQVIQQAHSHGLVAMLWMYARGKALKDTAVSSSMVAGLCGLGNALGADIVKIKHPSQQKNMPAVQQLRVATAAAGNTAVVCAGGVPQDPHMYLQELAAAMQDGKIRGCAVGRSIFQKPLAEALALSHAINAVVYLQNSADQAWNIYQQKCSEFRLQMDS